MQSIALEQDTKTIFGLTNKLELTGKSLDDFCSTTDYKTLPEASIVLVIGKKRCESKYSQPKELYEIAWRGEKYYIDKNSITLTTADQEKISSYTESDWKKAESDGIDTSLYLRKSEINELLNAINTTASKGLTILDWSVVDESEYTKGTGVKIQVLNPTKKDIKYIWFTLQGYNPVSDPVGALITLRAVGPIKPDSSGEYSFEYTWHSDIVETAKFKKIRVQYMDGTQKTIYKSSDIILSEKMLNIFNGIE